ncbi:helix-turn-helix transcriptional regulator [Neobacillus sp. PS3-40]|uniref:helix-turn-helix domain-containing protein n=1 Tax=Neobacillus sp. PS3-40 TaxID=3070679 RepID=UPI0027DEC6F6|nr:helix-turn-helix transcriptional regulator [Neobacillus sp. PS3-40]WML42697.1 helix-turn-helix transcriptional regulator [Neobacillus sp. PS3-40]
MDQQEFGQYIYNLRKKKKMSIRMLEDLSGVSNSYISQIENGIRRPSPDVLKKLYAPLDISYVELMVGAGHWSEDELLEAFNENEVFKEQVDLEEFLNKNNITFKGVIITDHDKKLIKFYLETLCSDRTKED